ncbi:MAG: VCBS repeat-containing protein, partial [Bdellovibrionales bacterium]|nr:VCBS repeat-containing protein [Bdellovibrionales bacterium]
MSRISRCPPNIAEDGMLLGIKFEPTDRFCLDGQKLAAVNGSYGSDGTEYRTKIETFSRIVSHGQYPGGNGPHYFTVELKNGLTYRYGYTSNSRQQLQDNETIAWSLDRVSDRRGNYYTVLYDQNSSIGELVPARIDYTGNSNSGMTPNTSVRFNTTPLNTPTTTFVLSRRYTLTKKISQIEVYINDQLVNSYNLQYVADPITSEDLLTEIQECGADGSCLSPTRFTWGSTDDQQSFEPVYSHPTGQTFGSAFEHPVISGDWNCDGKTDIARAGPSSLRIFLSKGDSFEEAAPLNDFWTYPSSDQFPLFAGDFNGDGCTDIARVVWDRIKTKISNKLGGFTNGPELPDFGPYAYEQGGTLSDYTNVKEKPLLLGDWNADGRTDIARFDSKNGYGKVKIYVASEQGFTYYKTFGGQGLDAPLPTKKFGNYQSLFTLDWDGDGITDFGWGDASYVYYYVSTETGVGFNPCYRGNYFLNWWYCSSSYLGDLYGYLGPIYTADWNGDGLTDVGMIGLDAFKACVSNGYSNTSHCGYIPEIKLSGNGDLNTRPIIVGDFNGDGLSDVARAVGDSIRVFYAQIQPNLNVGFVEGAPFAQFTPGQGFNDVDINPELVGDWNGDGLTDLGRATTTAFHFANHTAVNTQRLIQIEDGFGKITTIGYSNLTDPEVYTKDSSASYPQVDLTMPASVVKSFQVSDGLGGLSTYDFRYTGLVFDNLRRTILGFRVVDSVDEQSGIVSSTFYHQDFPYTGLPYRSEQRLANGTLISLKEDTWKSTTSSSGVSFPYASENKETVYEIDGSQVSVVTTKHIFDAYGNQTFHLILRSDGSSESTTNTFNNNVSGWLLGQLKSSNVSRLGTGAPPAPSVSKSASFVYTADGLLQSETLEPGNTNLELKRSYLHDVYGNI